MKNRAKRSQYLPLFITGIAIVLSSSAGLARMMGWGSSMTADPGDILTLDQMAPATTGKAGARPRCPECGVIVAVREVESHDDDTHPRATGGATAGNGTSMTRVRRREITVRMADGSSRVNYQASAENWRSGERVIVIGGTGPAQP